MFDVWLILVFGVVDVFNKLQYPLAPLVLAIVLGDKAEDLSAEHAAVAGKLGIFWADPLVATIMSLGVAMLLWRLSRC